MRTTVKRGAKNLLVLLMVVALVWWAPAGVLSPAVGVGAAQDEGPPQTPAAYYGNVTIDGEPAPAGTVIEAEIDGNVTGSITITEAGSYGGGDALDEKLTVEGDYGDDGTEVRFFVNNDEIERTAVNITDPKSVTWESGDVQKVDLKASVGQPLFEIEVADAPDSVNAGESISLTLNLTNTGAAAGEKTTVVSVDGEQRASSTDYVDVGASTQVALDVPTETADTGTVTVTADTGDDTATTDVEVKRPPEFAVALGLNNTKVAPGQEVNGTVNVTNVGGQSDTQNVTITIDGTEITTKELTLDRGASQKVSFAYPTTEGDAGTRTVSAASQDDSSSALATVSEPAFFGIDVIESESTLDVVAGQNATLVAEIENTGEETETQTVTVSRNGTELRNKEITLAKGEIGEIIAENETVDADAGSQFDVTVATDNETVTVPVNVTDRDAYLDVQIDAVNDTVDEPLPGNTTNISVDATIENLGTETVSETIEFRVNGETRATSSELEWNGESQSLTDFAVPIHPGETPAVDLEVASGDTVATRTVDVNTIPNFETTIVAASNETELDTETAFAPTINVTNTGDQAGDGLVRVRFNGTIERNVSVQDLAGGETTTVVKPKDGFALNASTEGTKVLEAEAVNNGTGESDDVSTRRVDIGAAPTFEIQGLTVDPSSSIAEGDSISIEATVNNTGDLEGNQTVVVEFEGTEINASVFRLGAAEEQNITAEYLTRAEDIGERSISISSDDDTDEQPITVRETAEFEVSDVAVPDQVIAGETAAVSVTVENVGGLAGNTTELRLFADGEVVGTKTVTLDADEVQLVEFDSGQVAPESAGTLDVVAATDDSLARDSLSVGTPGEFELELLSVTDPVTTADTLQATVLAENVGDGPAEETVSLKLDGQIVATTTATAQGGETKTVTLGYDIQRTLGDDESVTGDVAVESQKDGVDDSITIQDPPDAPNFRVTIIDAPGTALDTGQNVTIVANVTNIGDQKATQDIELAIADQVPETTGVTLESDATKTVELNFSTDVVGTYGGHTYTVASENQSVEDSITTLEPTPGTAEIVNTEIVTSQPAQEKPLKVNVTVRNVGDLNLNETVELDYLPVNAVSDSVDIDQLEPGTETTVTLSVAPPAEPRAGTFDQQIEVRAGDAVLGQTVPIDFGNIQSGVDAATADETVRVAPGRYEERNTITVDTDGVTVEAAGPVPTVTQPRSGSTAIAVTANDVRISDLRVAGSGSNTAVALAGDNTRLRNVRIKNWSTGIEEISGSNVILGSSILDSGTGVVLDGDGESRVEYTRISRSSTRGLVVYSDTNLIHGITVSNSKIGVELLGKDTEILGSTIRGNTDIGVRVSNVAGNITENDPSAIIHQSSLESNGVHAFIDNSSVNATTNWWGSPGLPVERVDYVVRSQLAVDDPLNNRPESQFEVSPSFPGEAVRNEQVSLDAVIENTGSKADLQTVELVVNGTAVDSTDVELNASEQKSITLTYTPDLTDGDQMDLAVRSLDDSGTETFAVLEPAYYALPSLSSPAEIQEGETLQIKPTVENTGETAGTQSVQLLINGTVQDTAEVSVNSGENVTDTALSYSPGSGDVGVINATVVSNDETRTVFVTVTEAPSPTPTPPPDEDEPDEEPPEDEGPTGPSEEEPEPPGEPPEVGDSPEGIESILPPEVELPADVTPVRAEVSNLTVDPETNHSTVSFSENASVESIELPSQVEGSVSVVEIESESETTGPTPGQSVAVSQITVPDEAKDQAATITQKVPQDRINAAGVEAEDLTVTRFNDSAGEWQRLETELLEETDTAVRLQAETPGFSYFAVTAVSEPTAVIDGPATMTVDETVTFDASDSTDEYGEITSYEWVVQGVSYSGETLTLTFPDAGSYPIELTVTNDAGKMATINETVVVEAVETTTVEPTTEEPTTTTTTTATPTTGTETPGFGHIVAIVGLMGAALLGLRRRNDV